MDNNELLKKYYPKTLDDIFSQEITVNILKDMIKTNKLYNMILYGEYGTGKTTVINKFIEEFYKDKYTLFTLKLCVSDNRGVDAIRQKIIPFVQTNHLFNKKHKFSRDYILRCLPSDLLRDSYRTISKWKGYSPTPLLNLNKLNKELNLNNIF